MSGYTPIFNTVFDGSLCGKWPDSAVWLTMLALCDKRGEVNLSFAAIAARTGWPLELLRKGVESLMQPDPDSQSSDEQGRRLIPIDPSRAWGWRVVNHMKYREKARLQSKDARRTDSGEDAARKAAERECPPVSPGVPRPPPDSPSSNADSDSREDSRRAASGAPDFPDSLDKALFAEARKIFGESIGGKINQAIRGKGKPWVVEMIERCRSMDQEAARAYFIAALGGRKAKFQV